MASNPLLRSSGQQQPLPPMHPAWNPRFGTWASLISSVQDQFGFIPEEMWSAEPGLAYTIEYDDGSELPTVPSLGHAQNTQQTSHQPVGHQQKPKQIPQQATSQAIGNQQNSYQNAQQKSIQAAGTQQERESESESESESEKDFENPFNIDWSSQDILHVYEIGASLNNPIKKAEEESLAEYQPGPNVDLWYVAHEEYDRNEEYMTDEELLMETLSNPEEKGDTREFDGEEELSNPEYIIISDDDIEAENIGTVGHFKPIRPTRHSGQAALEAPSKNVQASAEHENNAEAISDADEASDIEEGSNARDLYEEIPPRLRQARPALRTQPKHIRNKKHHQHQNNRKNAQRGGSQTSSRNTKTRQERVANPASSSSTNKTTEHTSQEDENMRKELGLSRRDFAKYKRAQAGYDSQSNTTIHPQQKSQTASTSTVLSSLAALNEGGSQKILNPANSAPAPYRSHYTTHEVSQAKSSKIDNRRKRSSSEKPTEDSKKQSKQEQPTKKPKMGNTISKEVLPASINDEASQGDAREQQQTIDKPDASSPAEASNSRKRDHDSMRGEEKGGEDESNQEPEPKKIKTGSSEEVPQNTNNTTNKEFESGQPEKRIKKAKKPTPTPTPTTVPKNGGWTAYEDSQLAQFIKARRDLEKKIPGMPVLRDEKLFRLVASQLQAIGINRTHAAAKNHWNREGRDNAQFEERVGKHTKSLVTSAQVPKSNGQKGRVAGK